MAVPVGPSAQAKARGQWPERTVRAMFPQLQWQRVPKGSITPVNVSQPVSTGVIRESVWRFSQRRMPGTMPGGGQM